MGNPSLTIKEGGVGKIVCKNQISKMQNEKLKILTKRAGCRLINLLRVFFSNQFVSI